MENIVPSVSPDITIVPREDLYGWGRMYAGGNFVGTCRWCCACELWIDVMQSTYSETPAIRNVILHGAICNEYDDWRCGSCVKEKRPNKIDRNVGPNSQVIPEEYADASINELPGRIKPVIQQFAERYRFMVVAGIPGSGKTRITWALVKKFIQNKMTITLLDAAIAQRTWTSCQHHHQRVKFEQIWENAAFLILDDLTATQTTDAWVRVLHVLIDRRRLAQKPMLITTAATAAELANVYNPAIHSRLNEFEWVTLPPIDYRFKKKQEREAKEQPLLSHPKVGGK